MRQDWSLLFIRESSHHQEKFLATPSCTATYRWSCLAADVRFVQIKLIYIIGLAHFDFLAGELSEVSLLERMDSVVVGHM
jgi:hypothetical protein